MCGWCNYHTGQFQAPVGWLTDGCWVTLYGFALWPFGWGVLPGRQDNLFDIEMGHTRAGCMYWGFYW